MIIYPVALEHLVKTFEYERPEPIDGTIVEDLVDNMGDIMEVWLDLPWVQLSGRLAYIQTLQICTYL